MIEKQFCNDKVRILYIADQRCNHDWQKMVRFSHKNVIYVFLTVVGIIYIYYLNLSGPKDSDDETELRTTSDGSKFENLACVLNREVAKNIGLRPSNKSFQCKTDGSEVFVPFSFLSHQYEVKGSLVNNNRGRFLLF